MALRDDSLIAQLIEMGFDPDAIQEYQVAMTTSNESFSMQAATEWLLQRSQRGNTATGDAPTLTLSPTSLPHHTPPAPSPSSQEGVQKATSSGGVLTSYSQPLKSRYDLGEEHAREKERYAAKERDDVIRKSKERRLAETKAKNLIKQQIADDRRARQSRGKAAVPAKPTESQLRAGAEEGGGERGRGEGGGERGRGEGSGEVRSTSSTCRLQIRLPTGKVLRHSLPATSSLSDVAQFVKTSLPTLTTITLVQPFPHHQFTAEEMGMSLHSLRLCPSASLVVPRQTGQSSIQAGSATGQSSNVTGSATGNIAGHASSATGESSNVTGQSSNAAAPSPTSGNPRVRRENFERPPAFHHRGGHVLGSGQGETAEEMSVETVNIDMQPSGSGVNDDIHQDRVDEQMEDESHSHSNNEEMESESDDDELPAPILPPAHFNIPPRPNLGLPFPHPQQRPPRAPQMQYPRFPPLGGQPIFRGEGHRLGGKEVAIIGDAQLMGEEGGRIAARKRTQSLESHPPADKAVRHLSTVPPLLSLCTRTLVSLTASYGLPSCASLPPRPAHILLDALQSQGRLNIKTLSSFYGCPIQSLVLDNYPYATNELVGSLWHFSSLTRLSLTACTIITDKAIAALFPYLSGLTDLNLEGCRQLTDTIFRPVRCCVSLESLNLCHVKATDRGVRLLLHSPLPHLTRLNLSHTHITANTLAALPQGTPALEELAIENTEVNDLTALCRLSRLHTLSIAHCDCGSVVGSLSGCGQLRSLNLSGILVPADVLQSIKDLPLTSLTLPNRAAFSDISMETICKLPLSSLNLMDYCYVSDVGVANIVSMTTLTALTLSKTKLTDTGMHSVAALPALRHLSIDNTVVTDTGLIYISGLTCLESLSLSDTKVTSGFILMGGLDRMGRLAKLNLSRTAVCDKGLLRLCLPSLAMLNLDWTSVTEIITLELLRENGCSLLTTLRNRNIGQPLPGQQLQD